MLQHPIHRLSLLRQTVTEKHKMNVPETMNEVLDMSDDEGEDSLCSFIITVYQPVNLYHFKSISPRYMT